MSDLDITALVLAEHEKFRRTFASLNEVEPAELSATWQDLADRLEVHASAEEELMYPKLLAVGDEDHEETDDAIRDHNDIRDAARDAAQHDVGSDPWWDAVRRCQDANNHHLDEEERDVLPELKDRVDEGTLRRLGERWLAFHDEHDQARGLSGQDKDPERYVEENSS